MNGYENLHNLTSLLSGQDEFSSNPSQSHKEAHKFNPGSIGPPKSVKKQQPLKKSDENEKDIWNEDDVDLQVDIDPRLVPGIIP